jgi:hypothetical protein
VTKADQDRFERELQEWLDEKARSGDYEALEGVITSWTLIMDRVKPGEEEDERWWSIYTSPGTYGTITMGHGALLIADAFATMAKSRGEDD